MSSFNPSRRLFIRAIAGFGLIGSPTTLALADPSTGARCHRSFRAALGERRWLRAFRSVDAEVLAPVAMALDGRVPPGLEGVLFRNGPAGFERGGIRYQHLFDGDGMIQAFRITANGVAHHARKVRTQKLIEESKAGRFLYAGAGSMVPSAIAARDNESSNAANIAVVGYEDELLALWEAGSAYALNPDTLETRRRVAWSPETDRLPFSAHPIVEANGSLWNFGLAQWVNQGVLIIYRIVPGRGLVQSVPIPLPFAGYMHSFAMTERSLIFYLSPNVLDREASGTYIARHRWRPELGGRLLIVDKGDLGRPRWLEAPAGFIFHFAGAKDEPDGGLSFNACWSPDPTLMNVGMTNLLCGTTAPLKPAPVTTIRVSKQGQVRLAPTDVVGEFPVVDRRHQHRHSGWIYLAGQTGDASWLNAVSAVNPLTGHVRQYVFPKDHMVEEHVFVPRAGESDGWLIGTSFDARREQTLLTVFDARRIEEGPQLTARMQRNLPLGFHGWFKRA